MEQGDRDLKFVSKPADVSNAEKGFADHQDEDAALQNNLGAINIKLADQQVLAPLGQYDADIEHHEILQESDFLHLTRFSVDAPTVSGQLLSLWERLVYGAWATLLYHQWPPQDVAKMRTEMAGPLAHLLDPIFTLASNLEEPINAKSFAAFIEASRHSVFDSSTNLRQGVQLLAYRLLKHMCYGASPALAEPTIHSLLGSEPSRLMAEESWYDLFLRIKAGYITPPAQFSEIIFNHGGAFLRESRNSDDSTFAILYDCVVEPLKSLKSYGGYDPLKEALIGSAKRCNNILIARWLSSAHGRLAAMVIKSDGDNDRESELDKEIQAMLLAFPHALVQRSAYLLYGILSIKFSAFTRYSIDANLVYFERALLEARNVLHPNQIFFLQAELTSYLLRKRKAAWHSKESTHGSVMISFIYDHEFGSRQKNLLRNLIFRLPEKNLSVPKDPWSFLSDYLKELRTKLIFPTLRKNLLSIYQLREFRQCWNNRDTREGLPRLLQNELRRLSNHPKDLTPSFACRMTPIWREVNCSSHNEHTLTNARGALTTLRIAITAGDVDLLVNDFGISYMIWQLSRYAFETDAELVSELSDMARRLHVLRGSSGVSPCMTDFI